MRKTWFSIGRRIVVITIGTLIGVGLATLVVGTLLVNEAGEVVTTYAKGSE